MLESLFISVMFSTGMLLAWFRGGIRESFFQIVWGKVAEKNKINVEDYVNAKPVIGKLFSCPFCLGAWFSVTGYLLTFYEPYGIIAIAFGLGPLAGWLFDFKLQINLTPQASKTTVSPVLVESEEWQKLNNELRRNPKKYQQFITENVGLLQEITGDEPCQDQACENIRASYKKALSLSNDKHNGDCPSCVRGEIIRQHVIKLFVTRKHDLHSR